MNVIIYIYNITKWGELSPESWASCLRASFLWGEFSLGRVVLFLVLSEITPMLGKHLGVTNGENGHNNEETENGIIHQWMNTFKFGLETTLSIQESSKVNLVQSLSNQ